MSLWPAILGPVEDPVTVVESPRALPSAELHELAEGLRQGELVEVSQRDPAIGGAR
jgi:hypothetical protein